MEICRLATCGHGFQRSSTYTSVREVVFSSLFVCLSVCLSVSLLGTLRKTSRMDLHEIFRECWQWTSELNKRLNFGGDPDHRLDTGIVFLIRHSWEIRKVVLTDCHHHDGGACLTIATMTSLHHRPRRMYALTQCF